MQVVVVIVVAVQVATKPKSIINSILNLDSIYLFGKLKGKYIGMLCVKRIFKKEKMNGCSFTNDATVFCI